MQKPNFSESIDTILKQDSRYDRDSYYFVREGLDFTLKMLKKNAQSQPTQRHVSGQELLEGLRRYVIEQFGPMAKTVLAYWGIHRCDDFGEVVFNMVEKGILGKTEQDSREDFKGGYDFDEAFVQTLSTARAAPCQPPPRCCQRARGRLLPRREDPQLGFGKIEQRLQLAGSVHLRLPVGAHRSITALNAGVYRHVQRTNEPTSRRPQNRPR